ncbi:hypothetical protein R1flu_023958 [Riccia fluitans]|uniref:Uncharacterized protein n=1 Tax=Riccia fluitans TaxID=41844 RepID=A0ABD1XWJ1_9MARC
MNLWRANRRRKGEVTERKEESGELDERKSDEESDEGTRGSRECRIQILPKGGSGGKGSRGSLQGSPREGTREGKVLDGGVKSTSPERGHAAITGQRRKGTNFSFRRERKPPVSGTAGPDNTYRTHYGSVNSLRASPSRALFKFLSPM